MSVCHAWDDSNVLCVSIEFLEIFHSQKFDGIFPDVSGRSLSIIGVVFLTGNGEMKVAQNAVNYQP